MQENGQDNEVVAHNNNLSETPVSWYSRLNRTEKIGAHTSLGGLAIELSGVIISAAGIFNRHIAGLSNALERIGALATVGGVLVIIVGMKQKGSENAQNDNQSS
jgi:hypothetical protein